MEKTLDTGEDKIQKICDVLRRETMEPAKQEAERIIEETKARAAEIIKNAEEQAEKLHEHVRHEIEQERNVFHSSLEQAAKQSMEELRQSIEKKLFNEELYQLIDGEMAKPKVIADLIDAIVKSIDKEGISTDLSALIPKTVSKEEINKLLAKGIVDKLREKSVVVSTIGGGAQVKLHDKKMTIDISDEALMELLSHYVRKDFRKLLFGEKA